MKMCALSTELGDLFADLCVTFGLFSYILGDFSMDKKKHQ